MTDPLSLAVRWAEDRAGIKWRAGGAQTAPVADRWGLTDDLVRSAIHKLADEAGAPNRYIRAWSPVTAGTPRGGHTPLTAGFAPRGDQVLHPLTQISTIVDATPSKLVLRPNLVDYSWWDNRHADAPAHHEASLSESVDETVEIGWSQSLSATVGQSLSVKAGSGPLEATAETSVSVTAEVGKSGSSSRSISLGVGSSVSADVPAGELWAAASTASKGDLTLDATIETKVSGDIVLDWGHRGQGFRPADGNWYGHIVYSVIYAADLLAAVGRSSTLTDHASIECGFFGASSQAPISDLPEKTIDAINARLWGGDPQPDTVFDDTPPPSPANQGEQE